MYGRAAQETLRIALVIMAVPLLVPIFMLTVFAPAFGRILQTSGLSGAESYVQYLAPGAVLMAVMLPATASVSVAIERQSGFYDRMRISPRGPRMSNLARRAADGTKLVIFAAILVVVSWLAGAEVRNWPMLILLGVVLAALWGFAYSGLSFALCLRTGKPEIAEALLPAFFPLLFVSSAFVPVDQLPDWMQVAAAVNPLTYLSDAIRGAYTGSVPTGSVLIAVACTVALIAVTQLLTIAAERSVAARA